MVVFYDVLKILLEESSVFFIILDVSDVNDLLSVQLALKLSNLFEGISLKPRKIAVQFWPQKFSEDTLWPSDKASSCILGSYINLEATNASGENISGYKDHKPQHFSPFIASAGVNIEYDNQHLPMNLRYE